MNALVAVTDVRGLLQLVDGWTVAMRNELDFQERSLTYSKSQVSFEVLFFSFYSIW